METLPAILKRLRVASKLSVAEVAEKLETKQSTVYGWEAKTEADGYRRISHERLHTLLEMYGASHADRAAALSAFAYAPVSKNKARPAAAVAS